MSWAAAIGASVATTAAGVKWIAAKRNAKKDEKNRPKYEIPAEIQQNLTQAQQMALQGLPEEQKQQYLSNLQRGSAQSLASSGSRKGGLAGIAGIGQQQNDAYANMLSMDSQARFQNQGVLMEQRQNMADYRDQAFQFNKVNPYYEQIKAREERNNALAQGVADGAGMFAGGGGGGGMIGGGGGGGGGGKSQQAVTPASGNQYFSPNGNDATGMYNFNPNSMNGQGGYNYEGNQ